MLLPFLIEQKEEPCGNMTTMHRVGGSLSSTRRLQVLNRCRTTPTKKET